MTYPNIHKIITEKGYKGSVASLRMFIQKERIRNEEFYEILYSRRDERLETWLEKIENFNIPELQTYVNGIRIDINAVKNGIKLKYNNGLAEGSVNKIKVIKRIMYGRNSFDLLKAKVLLHEHFRCEFN